MNWKEHPFTDLLSGNVVHLQIGVDQATTGVRHNDCMALADVSPELDCALCPTCHWQCRISGAWFMDLIAVAWASSIRRAVAPVDGVKGGLRSLRPERERRHGVQGNPRPALSFNRRNDRPAPTWGDPVGRRIDWPFVAFLVGWAVVFGVLVHFGLERSGW